jgi:hypothetical protein
VIFCHGPGADSGLKPSRNCQYRQRSLSKTKRARLLDDATLKNKTGGRAIRGGRLSRQSGCSRRDTRRIICLSPSLLQFSQSPLLTLRPPSFLRHRDSFSTCCRYLTATRRLGTPLRALLKSVNQMFNFRQLHLEMLISLPKCLFELGYEVHIFSWCVSKCSVTLAEGTKRCKVVVAKPTTALLTLGTASYTADSRYFRAVCGILTLDSAEYAGNWENTAIW